MAVKDTDVNFIQTRINEIGCALFSNDLEPEFCLFNNVIKTIKTDSKGTIWFLTSCKAECIKSLKGEFFACLNYYQKGKDFRLHITGKASIAETIDEVNGLKINSTEVVLIKYQIDKAEYFEYKTAHDISLKKRFKKYIDGVLFSNSHRLYDFSSSRHELRA